ncbi:hypothetical protein JR316_0004863 [Psilocybe cubensis]|uniref:Uncharacterized protein n=1 Tax=Psilocybe cubensis TaxID=181762 RepID=A0ACB8H437_PSICU|nr:hypothetical protein JR316_0004863 [Psilocybe cubensis]KAH9482763.1 hypothetical protein JR316_0004863 [Psilocybe cubensis]
MDFGHRWSPSIVRRFLLVIILVCAPVAHCSQTVAAPNNEKNGFNLRRDGNLTDPGLNHTSAQMSFPLASSTSIIISAVESSSLSSSLPTSSAPYTYSYVVEYFNVIDISIRFRLFASTVVSGRYPIHAFQSKFFERTIFPSTTPPIPETMTPPPTQPITISASTPSIFSDVNPVTSPYIYPSPDPTSEAIIPSSNSAAISTTSFWHKKGAVAAVFLFISLIGVAIIALVVVYYVKKRNNRKHARLDEELFEKYSEPGHRSNSPGLSINGTPMDAFATSGIQYNNHFTSEDHQTPLATPTASQSSFPIQHPDYYNPHPVRYLAPSQFQPSVKKQGQPHAHSDSRASYQPSVDSFYGAASQPLGYHV